MNDLFDRYQGSEGVTSIKIAKPMFGMLDKLNINDSELNQVKPLLSKINGLKILILEKPDSSSINSANRSKFNNYLNLQSQISKAVSNLNYEELMSVNSKDSKIKFLSAKSNGEMLDDLLLNISSEGNQILMMLDGKISMEDVNRLVNEASERRPEVIKNTNNKGVEIRKVARFSGIEVSSGIKINYTQGSPQIVRVETDPEKLKYISTEVVNGILRVSINSPRGGINFRKITVDVVSPEINEIRVTSGATFNGMNKIQSNKFNITTSSGAIVNANMEVRSDLNIEATSGSSVSLDVSARKVYVKSTSGSSTTISGKAASSIFHISSAGSCNAQNLVVNTAEAEVSSAGSLSIHVADELNVKASSAGSVRYKGNPKVVSDVSKMTGATLSKF